MSNSISHGKRMKVYAKTQGYCAYCGTKVPAEGFAIDHVYPKSLGGSNRIDNLLPSCHPCNTSKGTKTIEHFRLFVAAKSVTGNAVFGHSQLIYLRDAGAFPVLGFDMGHKFYFEVAA